MSSSNPGSTTQKQRKHTKRALVCRIQLTVRSCSYRSISVLQSQVLPGRPQAPHTEQLPKLILSPVPKHLCSCPVWLSQPGDRPQRGLVTSKLPELISSGSGIAPGPHHPGQTLGLGGPYMPSSPSLPSSLISVRFASACSSNLPLPPVHGRWPVHSRPPRPSPPQFPRPHHPSRHQPWRGLPKQKSDSAPVSSESVWPPCTLT